MKYENTNYMQLSRVICNEEYVKKLSVGARMLFVTLNELEQRYCNSKTPFFYRTNEELAADMGVSVQAVKKYKKELKNVAPELVRIRTGHFIDQNTGKKSEKHFTTYEIMK